MRAIRSILLLFSQWRITSNQPQERLRNEGYPRPSREVGVALLGHRYGGSVKSSTKSDLCEMTWREGWPGSGVEVSESRVKEGPWRLKMAESFPKYYIIFTYKEYKSPQKCKEQTHGRILDSRRTVDYFWNADTSPFVRPSSQARTPKELLKKRYNQKESKCQKKIFKLFAWNLHITKNRICISILCNQKNQSELYVNQEVKKYLLFQTKEPFFID